MSEQAPMVEPKLPSPCGNASYQEPDQLPAQLALPLLLQWRQHQDAVAQEAVQVWREVIREFQARGQADGPPPGSWPWALVFNQEGASFVGIVDAEGNLVVAFSRTPAGQYCCAWALSAGTLQEVAAWVESLREEIRLLKERAA
jgi:hypothetical protein